jgi:tetratricopeptide (TPR) repeat protein
VSPRGRIFVLVTLAAVVASGVVVIGVLATRSDVPSVKPRSGSPPIALDLVLRSDPEALSLARAEQLYDRAHRPESAAKIFARYSSLEAKVGAAMAAWPSGTVARLETLVAEYPRSALVALHLGLALYWSRRNSEAVEWWRAAQAFQPDSFYAVRAGDFLHPRYAPGLPNFVPSFGPPARIRALQPARRLVALGAMARGGGAHAKLLYGVALQRLDRPHSAEKQFAAAAREAPDDPEARVAAAVGRFDKDNPSVAFGRLGPLVRVFPHAPTIRFHLGLLLLWLGQIDRARDELRQARAQSPDSAIGREAAAYLSALRTVGTP